MEVVLGFPIARFLEESALFECSLDKVRVGVGGGCSAETFPKDSVRVGTGGGLSIVKLLCAKECPGHSIKNVLGAKNG